MRPNRNVKFWAITASVAVHLIVLTFFAIIKFSPSQTLAAQNSVPTATVTQIKNLIQPEKIIPKPKIKSSQTRKITKKSEEILPAGQFFDSIDKNFDSSHPPLQNTDLAKPAVSTAQLSMPVPSQTIQAIDFFGSRTASRKICYLVDCSGSMRGIFNRVQNNLKNSIQSLQPDQYFCIIFFGDNKLFEYDDGRLQRASEKNKASAYDFIASIAPAGQTNAMVAMERAVQIRDSSGNRPAVIYFLTDGFELAGENETMLSDKINNLLNRFGATKVNTIGFWSVAEDAKLLKMIAQTSGGEFVNITD